MVNDKMKQLGTNKSAIRELFDFGNKLKRELGEQNVYDFSLGNPNVPAPQCVTQSIFNNLENQNVHAYTTAQGIYSVRRAISDYTNERWNIGITPDDVYVTSGAASALSIVFKAINEGQDEFIVIAPFFPEYKIFIEAAGGKCVIVPCENDFSLDVEKIASAINKNTKAVIINSPNNPTGVIYPEEQIIDLANELKEKEQRLNKTIYLISDEPYRELTYGKRVPFPMLYYADTIICHSFSKNLSLPGERIGYIAVNPNTKERKDVYAAICGSARALGYVCAPSLFQRVVAENLGKTADVSKYKSNRDLLFNALTEYGYECCPPDGAFYLFVKAIGEKNQFFEECKKEGVLVVPSESFGMDGYVRISYCVSSETVKNALPLFKKIYDRIAVNNSAV